MAQDKAPDWAMKAAEEVAISWFPEFHHDFQVLSQDIALALSQAYERGQESMRERAGWQAASPEGLEAAIAEFKAALPGWWYSVCECQVSCDASCAPTAESEHINMIREAGDPFDSGFHADLRQPSSLEEALRNVMKQALAEIAIRSLPIEQDSDGEGKGK